MSLVADADQVVGQSFHNFGSFTRLSLVIVHCDQHSLLGLDTNNTAGALLSVHGAIVAVQGNVLFASDHQTARADSGGVGEGLGHVLGFVRFDLVSQFSITVHKCLDIPKSRRWWPKEYRHDLDTRVNFHDTR